MKEKKMYDKPLLKVMEIELNECIANSFTRVQEGEIVEESLNATSNSGTFGAGKNFDWDGENWKNPNANRGW